MIETKEYKINYSESLKELAIETISLLDVKLKEYKEIFGINVIEQVKVNYFDNIDEFRNFIYNLRGEKDSLPKYATATYDNGMINSYINPKNQIEYMFTASHELFHILYMKYILKDDYSNRIVWYDEGMAQFVSGEKQKYIDDVIFSQFYIKVKENTKLIPSLNDIEHGELFCNENYNGYDLCYLAIRYLSEIMDKKDFFDLMSNFEKIKKIGNSVLIDMFSYYDEKFLKKKIR